MGAGDSRVMGEAGAPTCEMTPFLSWPGLRLPPPPGVLNLTWHFGKTGNSNLESGFWHKLTTSAVN